jgi:Zn-dependent protease with chaperone function
MQNALDRGGGSRRSASFVRSLASTMFTPRSRASLVDASIREATRASVEILKGGALRVRTVEKYRFPVAGWPPYPPSGLLSTSATLPPRERRRGAGPRLPAHPHPRLRVEAGRLRALLRTLADVGATAPMPAAGTNPRALARRVASLVALLATIGACGVRYNAPAVSEEDVLTAAGAAQVGGVETAAPRPARSRSAQDDAALLAEVARRLAAAAQPVCEAHLGRPCAFEVVLAASDAPRAWAAGRGRITVTAGMLRLLGGDADQVAALVGHEGHHLAGHILRQFARGTAAGIAASALLGAVVPFGGLAGWALGQGAAELGAGAARLAFSKAEEREADYLAAYLVARAGYDLDRAGWLWTRLSGDEGHAPVAVVAGPFDTHPAAAERLAAWRRAVAEVRTSTDLMPRRARP